MAELDLRLGGVDLSGALRGLGRCRTRLEFSQPEQLVPELHPTLQEMQRTCSVVNDSLSERCFPQTLALTWSVEGEAG